MTRERFRYLLEQYLLQQLTEEELNEFFDAAVLPEFEPVIKAALDKHLGEVAGSSAPGQAMRSYENFKHLVAAQQAGAEIEHAPKPVLRRMWLRYAAAAVLLAAAATWMWFNKDRGPEETVQVAGQPKPVDFAPGGNRAVLTLADGTTILLDSSNNGMLAMQGNARIEKTAGDEVVYKTGNGGTDAVMMNTMATPRGGQYKLTLPDGSKVWLNAASSITYPTAFIGNDRTVSVTGELYFEIAHNAAKPFIVKKGATNITVLGTHFNVHAYDDEAQMKITLLEGSVKVASVLHDQWALLKPGQQVSVSPSAQISQPVTVETDKVMAWKNGIFNFHKASLQEVMRQLERWYDVEVMYEKGIPHMEFGGEMGRDLTLSQVLEGFKEMEVHFRIESNRRLIVMP